MCEKEEKRGTSERVRNFAFHHGLHMGGRRTDDVHDEEEETRNDTR